MTTPNTDLRQQIALALYDDDREPGEPRGGMHPGYLEYAAAVLPIVEAAVKRGQAEAWDEGWKERSRRDIYRSGPLDDSRPVPGPPRSLNPYRATETGAEHDDDR